MGGMRNAGARVNHGGEILQGQTCILKHSREFSFSQEQKGSLIPCSVKISNSPAVETEKRHKLHFLSVLVFLSDRSDRGHARDTRFEQSSLLSRDFYEITVGRDIFIGVWSV